MLLGAVVFVCRRRARKEPLANKSLPPNEVLPEATTAL